MAHRGRHLAPSIRQVTLYLRLILALALLATTSVGFAAVSTDQADYSPGSTVTISGDNSDGAGYLAGELVVVNVDGPNGYTSTCEGIADDLGAWSCQVHLWDSVLAVGNYTFTASGSLSGVSQGGHFTDAINVASFDSGCNSATSSFVTGSQVCAKATGLPGGGGGTSGKIEWIGPDNTLVRSTSFTGESGNFADNFTPLACGQWTLKVYAPSSTQQDSSAFSITGCAPANNAPSVALTGGPTTVNESNTTEHTYTFLITDPDSDDSWTFVSPPSCGAAGTLVASSDIIDNDTKTGSFKCKFDDGVNPPVASTVAVKVEDAAQAQSNNATLGVTVNNVAPTASASASSLNGLSGVALTFTFSATDPSNTDTLAGINWRFNDGQGSGYGPFALVTPTEVSPATPFKPSATYAACGSFTATAQARDKDLGESNQPTVAVSVSDGDWHGAIKPAVRNQVQAGRVVPVQIRIGCEGVPLTGLTPGIRLLAGDQDPDTTAFDEAVSTTSSVSAADTTGFMRETSDGYIYNLQIPKSAKVGDKFTIAVRPWGSDGPQLRAVVEIRK